PKPRLWLLVGRGRRTSNGSIRVFHRAEVSSWPLLAFHSGLSLSGRRYSCPSSTRLPRRHTPDSRTDRGPKPTFPNRWTISRSILFPNQSADHRPETLPRACPSDW